VSCHRTILAAGEACLIEQCSCGHIHFTVGPITMRLEPAALGSLAETFATASRTACGANGQAAVPRNLN
jgi:hypothetical protein